MIGLFYSVLQAVLLSPCSLLGLGILCWALAAYFTGETRRLRHIPTASSTSLIAAYVGGWWNLFQGKKLVDDSFQKWPRKMFRISEPSQWTVVASDKNVIAELLRVPESTLSAAQATEELIQTKHTFGDDIMDNPYFFPVLSNQLRKALPHLVPQIYIEVVDAFEKHIPLTNDWSSIKCSNIIQKIICQASNRAFVGFPLCRNSEFINLVTQYTPNVFGVAFILRCFPRFLRPLVAALISNIPNQKLEAMKFLGPVIDTRRDERQLHGKEVKRQSDMLTWLIETAKEGLQSTNASLGDRLMALNFGSVHPCSMAFLQALYYLAASPEYAHLLREEVDEVIREHGWSKAGLDEMKIVDSFLKESQRMNPQANVAMGRLGLKDYTFSDGTFVPKGTTVAINIHGPHFDSSLYTDPRTFDPLRFVKLQDSSTRSWDMTATSVEFLAFGHGRHACPGRYFAAVELKMMLAYVVAHYDIKLAGGRARPMDLWMMTWCVPNQSADVLFRKRRE